MFKKIIFIVVPLILITSHISQRIRTWYRVKKEVSELKSNIEYLEKEQQDLKEKKKFYQSEEFIRREAREKLGLTAKDELVLILPELPNLPEEKVGRRISSNSPAWKQWWDLFFAVN